MEGDNNEGYSISSLNLEIRRYIDNKTRLRKEILGDPFLKEDEIITRKSYGKIKQEEEYLNRYERKIIKAK